MARHLKILPFIIIVLFASIPLWAESLSDMQLDQFNDSKSTGDVKAHTDPFASGVTAVDDLSIEELQLTGIAYNSDNHAFALISGYLVKPGDRIAGYRVDLIEKDKVRLRRVDDVYILALGGGI